MTKNDIIKRLGWIRDCDKTPAYPYPSNSNKRNMHKAENNCGFLAGKGRRWQTPIEIVFDMIKEIEKEGITDDEK